MNEENPYLQPSIKMFECTHPKVLLCSNCLEEICPYLSTLDKESDRALRLWNKMRLTCIYNESNDGM